MRPILFAGLSLLLTLTFAVPATAQTPDGATPNTAIPLISGQTQRGSITGRSGGAFAYYTIDYPGGASVGTLRLNFSPTHEPITRSIGLNVWQSNTRLATMGGVSPNKGANSVTFASDKKGPLLVQVYNYLQSATAFYEVILSGIAQPSVAPQPAEPGVPEAPAPATGASTPDTATPLVGAASGDLTGSAGGAFRYHTIEYPGDGRTVTITLHFAPSDSTRTSGIGLHVWQGSTRLAVMTGSSPTKGMNQVTFSSNKKGTLLIQVFNYAPGLHTFYHVSVRGI